MSEYAIIVAGGKGSRMRTALPKQFLPLHGIPVLMHTLTAFQRYSSDVKLIVVLPGDERRQWEQLVSLHSMNIPHQVVDGGETRFQSVKHGLQAITGGGVVAIHDGVRPLVSPEIIGASFQLATAHGSAIAAVRLKESIRMTDQDSTKSMDRSRFRLIQTPQTFRVDLIQQAYRMKEDDSFTDDASVFERAGYPISLFEGSFDNIKITTPEDMIIASALMDARRQGLY